tara:strand:+ start:1124 stop:1339 length:216 start_codon:yes stop_codon:yes gene_type:complete
MYYISNISNDLQLSAMKKRLRDFRGIEGQKYHVRTTKEVGSIGMVPIYQFKGGRLVKTGASSVFNVFKESI